MGLTNFASQLRGWASASPLCMRILCWGTESPALLRARRWIHFESKAEWLQFMKPGR